MLVAAGCYCKGMREKPSPAEVFPEGVCAFLAEASAEECAAAPEGCTWVLCWADWRERFGVDYWEDEAFCEHLADGGRGQALASSAALSSAREMCPGRFDEQSGLGFPPDFECEVPAVDVDCEAPICSY